MRQAWSKGKHPAVRDVHMMFRMGECVSDTEQRLNYAVVKVVQIKLRKEEWLEAFSFRLHHSFST